METILINGIKYDPYFILDVTCNDDFEKINKSFKRKAKIWHPDKLPLAEKKDIKKVKERELRFKILVDCYDYILNKKNKNVKNREHINVIKNNNIPSKSLDNSNELNAFNLEFKKTQLKTPNDYGYSVDRIKNEKEYENFNYKPQQLFGNKSFNPNEFNKTFDYNKEIQSSDSHNELSLYYKTTDGFNGYNGSDLGGCANVSSYNGVMIVGDNFGENGSGYYDTSYSDYKQVFALPKNPENIKVPTSYNVIDKNKKLTNKEYQDKFNIQIQSRKMNINPKAGSMNDFKIEEQRFLNKQKNDIKQKIEQDRNMILQYKHMYDKNTIQEALSNNLITSKDYCNEDNIDKRFLKTKF